MSTIGFVGLGSMGAPVAGRLLQDHEVGYGRRDIAAFLEVLGQMAGPGRDAVRDAA